MSDEAEQDVIARAIAFLHGNLSGILRFDSDHRPIRIIVGDDGRLAASAMVAMIRSFDTTLCLPDEEEGSLHLQVTLEEFEENGPFAALADRWRIYHGDPPDVRWARMQIDAARFAGMFIDGETLERANPLAPLVPALCRTLNASHTDLVRCACLGAAQIAIERPVVVGVDPLGIDVRGAFDVVRIAAEAPLIDEADVLATLRDAAASAA